MRKWQSLFSSSPVSAQMEEWVVQLAVEHAVVTMATHSHDPHVTLWGAKVIAHGVHNGT